MALRWKILLLSLFVTLSVGVSTTWMFANSWKSLAQAYALSSLGLSLDKMKLDLPTASEDGWSVKFLSNGKAVWKSQPLEIDSSYLEKFESLVFQKVSESRLAEGVFELPIPLKKDADPQDVFVSFRKYGDEYAVAGISSEKGLRQLSAWAAPFLTIVLVVLGVAFALAFIISSRLNASYELIERALENIGAGRLKDLKLPDSVGDKSLRSVSSALRATADILAEKDEKIAKVSNLANEDSMTGVPNYRAFEDYVEGLMSGIFVPDSVPVLGILDLDYFKKVNDSYGHQVGDFVLKEVTRIVIDCIRYDADTTNRSPDFFGRYGGEEFVIIFTSVSPASVHVAALRILHRIKSSILEVPAEISENGKPFELGVSASIGLALWSGNSFSKEEWVKEADQALYAAKKAGRGRLVQLNPQYREWT